MKAIKLTEKERELFDLLTQHPGGGITAAYKTKKHCMLQGVGWR